MQWGNTYDKHIVSYYCVASLSRQRPILLQDTTPYEVPEIWENTLPLPAVIVFQFFLMYLYFGGPKIKSIRIQGDIDISQGYQYNQM